MNIKLLTKHNLEFLSLKGGCTGSSESTLVKMPHCWKSHVKAHVLKLYGEFLSFQRCGENVFGAALLSKIVMATRNNRK